VKHAVEAASATAQTNSETESLDTGTAGRYMNWWVDDQRRRPSHCDADDNVLSAI